MGKGFKKAPASSLYGDILLRGGLLFFLGNSMSTEGFKRKLSAILSADVEGYREIAK